MPRDASETRERLIRSGAHLFARKGIYGVTLHELHEHAGQRNESAVHYHFGSREGLVTEIASRHLAASEERRHRLLDEAVASAALEGREPSIEELCRVVVWSSVPALADESGRDYLRIAIQRALSRPFQRWDEDRRPPALARCMDLIVGKTTLGPDVATHRVNLALLSLTADLASRAVEIEDFGQTTLTDEQFAEDLARYLAGALSAP